MRSIGYSVCLVALTAALLAGCGGSRQGSSVARPQAETEEPSAQQEGPEKEEVMIEGSLEPTVEAGGWVVESGGKTYLLLRIEPYRDQPWFSTGTRVRAWGEESPDTITIFMQGMPFLVSRLEPVE